MEYPYRIPLKTVNGNPNNHVVKQNDAGAIFSENQPPGDEQDYQGIGHPGGYGGQAPPFQFWLK